jgi:lipopolysaccharide transport system ATP-binding protein
MMGDVARQGRTVLFVSHNMVAVQNLCNRTIWLDKGRLMRDGAAAEVISEYVSTAFSSQTEQAWSDPETAPGNDKVRLRRVRIVPDESASDGVIATSTPLAVEVQFWNLVPGQRLHVCLHVLNEQQIVAFTTSSNETDLSTRDRPLADGLYRSVCSIPKHLLNAGVHRIAVLMVWNGRKIVLRLDDALTFDVREIESRPGAWYGKEPGAVRPMLPWRTDRITTSLDDGLAAGPSAPGWRQAEASLAPGGTP